MISAPRLSDLARSRIESEGLGTVLAARAERRPLDPRDWEGRLERADLLALGAAADWVRRVECGPETRVWVPSAPATGPDVRVFSQSETARATALVREVAKARLLSRPGARVVFDWGALGLDLAEIVIAFGASELAGPLALSLAEPTTAGGRAAERARVVAFIERAGYVPRFLPAAPEAPLGSTDAAPVEPPG